MAAHCVTVTVLGTLPEAGFPFAVSVRTSSLDDVVPLMSWIL